MARKRRRHKARVTTVLQMILACKAKSWDARDRRSKDARRTKEWKDEAS